MDTISPDAQLHLAERFADLMEKWGSFLFVVVLVLVIYRKEIGALILSMRRENNADALMTQMNASFSQNLHFFEEAVKDTAAIRKTNEELVTATREGVQVMRALKEELIRGKGR